MNEQLLKRADDLVSLLDGLREMWQSGTTEGSEDDRRDAQAEVTQKAIIADVVRSLRDAVAQRDAQVREAFFAGYRGSLGFVTEDEEAEREFQAWRARLAALQRARETDGAKR